MEKCLNQLLFFETKNRIFPGGAVDGSLPANTWDASSIPGWGRSPAGGNGNPSSILAWVILRTEQPEGLQSTESQRV